MPELAPEPIVAEDYDAFVGALRAAFHSDPDPEEAPLLEPVFDRARMLAVRDGGAIVATAGSFARELTVPGGPLPAAAVTLVGVLATHRRRGLLRRMMGRQLEELHAAGEAVAALWASEGGIYGRFGYGPASKAATLRVRTARARLGDPAAAAGASASTRLVTAPLEATDELAAVYEAVRPARPGLLDRTPEWWTLRLHDPEKERDGAGSLRAVVVSDDDGTPAGYALYAVKLDWRDGGPDGEARVREAMVRGPAAAGAVWRHLLGLDLVERVGWQLGDPDGGLGLALTDPSAVRLETGVALWVRLVDVGRALASRTYGAPVDVVLDVADPFCPWNAGRLRLAGDAGGATCEPTGDAADLELGAAELGAAYLGGTTLTALAAAGRVCEHTPGALAATALALRGAVEPWCPEVF